MKTAHWGWRRNDKRDATLSDDNKKISSARLPEDWRPARHVFAFHEDTNANAVLITSGGEIYAVAEERLTRKRFQAGFPQRSLAWITEASGVRLDEVDTLVFGNPTHFLPRVLGTHFPSFEHDMFGTVHKIMLTYHHLCFSVPAFAAFMKLVCRSLLRFRFKQQIVFVDHHDAHAASAYYTSGFKEACAVSADNYGDGYAAKVFDCQGSEIKFVRGVSALNSPGQFYGEIAQIAGIHPLLAGKLTGMAASGNPDAAASEMKQLFDSISNDTNFTRTFGLRRSKNSDPFNRLAAVNKPDLAASAQRRFEDTLTRFVRKAVRDTGRRHVALAGGSFANVRLNQKILELPEVDSVWIHPAMTDQGIAMGAALAHIAAQKHPLPFQFENILLGPAPTEDEMIAALKKFDLAWERPEHVWKTAARLLADGKSLARFDGPMEYGLRALGNRSILYRPDDPHVHDWLNKKLQRASYMPFAPMTMEPHAAKCYQNVEGALEAARFMTISFYATDWMKEKCPGVVHIDGTVRPQVLRASDNPGMYRILEEYYRLTGLPSVLNTSFNMHSEPIVATADDACLAFKESELDHLVIGPFVASTR